MNTKKVEDITFLRGWAILFIVIMHIIEDGGLITIPWCIRFPIKLIGGYGVYIFFFCSGYGLHYSRLMNTNNKEKLGMRSWGEWIKRRFLRIYIPYIIVIIGYFVYFLIKAELKLGELLAHILLYKMFSSEWDICFCENYWYISTAIQFYLIYPFLWMLSKRVKNNIFFVSLGFLITIMWVILPFATGIGLGSYAFHKGFGRYIFIFTCGMVAAEHRLLGKKYKIKSEFVGMGSCLFFYVIMYISKKPVLLDLNDMFLGVGWLLFAHLFFRADITSINQIFCRIDEVGYEWFLLHGAVINILCMTGMNSKGPVWVITFIIVSFAISLVIAKLYHLIIEKFKRKRIWIQH